jgi:hypothetical protein
VNVPARRRQNAIGSSVVPAHRLQHFVPQFYLGNFAEPSGRRMSLFLLAKRELVRGVTPQSQCRRPRYYDREPGLEAWLADLESDASVAIREVVRTNRPPARGSPSELDLLEFTLIQRGRTPAAEKFADAMVDEVGRLFPNARNLHETNPKDHLLFTMDVAEDSIDDVRDLALKLLYNTTDVEFITSDAPVVVHNQWSQQVEDRGTAGYLSSGLQIFLPVSPRHMLLFYDAKVYRVGRSTDRAVPIARRRDVENLNALQLNSAIASLYYSGCPRTEASIGRLPLHRHRPQHELVTSSPARPDDARRDLFHLFERAPSVRLNVSFISIAKRWRPLPLSERAGRLRRPVHEDSGDEPSAGCVL